MYSALCAVCISLHPNYTTAMHVTAQIPLREYDSFVKSLDSSSLTIRKDKS